MQEKIFNQKFDVDCLELFNIVSDFKNFKKFCPDQIKEIKIIKKNNSIVETEEILTFNTYFKNSVIKQKTIHEIDPTKSITSKIIEGPFKDTTIKIEFQEINNQTEVNILGDIKVGLKYIILKPVIKKLQKGMITALIYQMKNSLDRRNST